MNPMLGSQSGEAVRCSAWLGDIVWTDLQGAIMVCLVLLFLVWSQVQLFRDAKRDARDKARRQPPASQGTTNRSQDSPDDKPSQQGRLPSHYRHLREMVFPGAARI